MGRFYWTGQADTQVISVLVNLLCNLQKRIQRFPQQHTQPSQFSCTYTATWRTSRRSPGSASHPPTLRMW